MKNPYKKVWQVVSSASHSKTFSLLALLVVILAIPITVFIAQKQQELRQRASGVTCNENEVSLNVSPNPANVGASVHGTITGNASTYISDEIINNQTGRPISTEGICTMSAWNDGTCTFNTPGSYKWTHNWRNCEVDFNNCSPAETPCSKSVNVTINGNIPTSTPTSTPTVTRAPTTHEIHGTVWIDTNGDGDKQTTEQGRDGVTVTLGGASTETQTTNASGHYFFLDLNPGSYSVTISVPNGFFITGGTGGTTPSKTVTISNTFADVSWGIKPTAIGGGNGSIAFSGMTTSINNNVPTFNYTIEDTLAANDTFPDLRERTVEILVYRGSETIPKKYQNIFTYQRKDLNNNQITKTFTTPSYDASYYTPGSYRWQAQVLLITGTQYASGYSNFTIGTVPGTYEISGSVLESAVGTTGRGKPNVRISLARSGGTGGSSRSTDTGIDGSYSFNNLVPGTYTVTMSKPAGYKIVSGGNPRTVNLTQDTDVSWTIFQSSEPTSTVKSACPPVGAYCTASAIGCIDDRYDPNDSYVCNIGVPGGGICCVLKGNPTPPTCYGCQSAKVWNVCVDDDTKCTIPGQTCKNAICQGGTLPTVPVIPTKPGGATSTPIATATPVSSTLAPTATTGINVAKLFFTLKLQAIGNGDIIDQNHPAARENKTPNIQTREITVEIFDTQNVKKSDGVGNVTYDSANGLFTGTVPVSNMQTGDYYVKVKSAKYLRRLIGKEINQAVQHIVTGATPNQMPRSTLIIGDTNNDNSLDIEDYNNFKNCFGARANTSSCTEPDTDLNDDRAVDLTDYAWLFYSFELQYGD